MGYCCSCCLGKGLSCVVTRYELINRVNPDIINNDDDDDNIITVLPDDIIFIAFHLHFVFVFLILVRF